MTKPIIKPTRKKSEASYKTLYLKEELEKKIEKIAAENDTSFNNVVISLIEFGIKKYKEEDKKEKDLVKE